MPSMEITVFLLSRKTVSPDEFDIIARQLKSEQIPVKMKKGAVSYNLGTLVTTVEGREGLFGTLAFNPSIALQTEGNDREIKALYVEWTPREL